MASRKTGLGKGLEALIPGKAEGQPVASSQIPASGIDEIAIDLVIPNPRQPRTIFAEEQLGELADSIKEHGVIQPLVVMQGEAEGQYILIAGERRLQASKLAGLDKIPAVIREKTSDQHLLELALIENVQRADLSPLETAVAYAALASEFGLTQKEVAERVGKSRVAVTNTMGLLEMSDKIKEAILDDLISEGHARALKGLTHAQQNQALRVIIKDDLSVRKTEDLARKYKGHAEKVELSDKPGKTPEILDLETRLFEHFTTKVNINHGENGGKIVMHYTSDEEMNALLMKLLGEL